MNSARILLVGVVLGLLGSAALPGCGEGDLSEATKKAFVTELREKGEALEASLAAKYPEDEEARDKEFRRGIERLETELRSRYRVPEGAAGEIYREAREKGWW